MQITEFHVIWWNGQDRRVHQTLFQDCTNTHCCCCCSGCFVIFVVVVLLLWICVVGVVFCGFVGFVGFVGLSLGFNFFVCWCFWFWVLGFGFLWDLLVWALGFISPMEPADLLKPLLRGWSLPLLVFTVAYTLVYLPFVEKGVSENYFVVVSLSLLFLLSHLNRNPLFCFLAIMKKKKKKKKKN